MAERDRNWHRLIGGRLRLRELRILHKVTQAGSMAKAAQALSMTQPAVSQAIGMLEAALDLTLLERSPAGVALTEAGAILLRRTLEAVDALNEGIDELEALAEGGAGEVVVGASESYIAGGALSAAILRLREQSPLLHVHVVESNTAAMDFTDLRERRVDVMLGRGTEEKPPEDVVQAVLLSEPLLLVTGGKSALAQAPRLRLADLADKPWVLAPAGTAVHALVASALLAEGISLPAPVVTTYSMMLRLQLLAEGEYVTAFPESLVRRHAATWGLVVLDLPLGKALPVSAYTLRSRAASRPIRAFLEAARASHGA